MSPQSGGQMQQQMVPLTPVVKKLIIINVAIWFFGIVIAEQYLFSQPYLTENLSLLPAALVSRFQFWQPLTYMFIHASSPLQIIFNMLLLWWLGGELERHWGKNFFLLYFFVCGIGAAFLYVLLVGLLALAFNNSGLLMAQVQGASPAIFGLLVAYGLVFGERIVYFFFFFPMKAKWFVAILGGLELVLTLNSGLSWSGVSNVANLTGLLAGFLFLVFWSRRQQSKKGPKGDGRRGKLKLVVNNDEFTKPDRPKYWN